MENKMGNERKQQNLKTKQVPQYVYTMSMS